MKMRMRAAVLWIVMFVLVGAWATPARAEVSFDFFYSNLSPHGSWLVSAQYGRVWQPGVYADNWNPYYDGHWVYADVGWTWVSDYEWGGIPYHYGTWVYDPEIGWVWVPGYVWAPAWVVFRIGPDYIGWAPVSPGFTVGVSTSFGVRAAGPFVFVSAGNFLAPRIRTCLAPTSTTRVIIRNTRIVNTLVVERNVVVNRGPDVRIIERASGRRVRERPIEKVSGVGPDRYMTREQIVAAPRWARRGLRVAEPVPASRPLPRGGPRTALQPEPRASRMNAPRREPQEQPRVPTRPRIVPGTQEDRGTPQAEHPSAGTTARSAAPQPQTERNKQPPRRKSRPVPRPDHEHDHQ